MKAAQHRKTGAAIGDCAEIVHVNLECVACMATQLEPLDADGQFRSQVMKCSCLFCGRVATMRRAS